MGGGAWYFYRPNHDCLAEPRPTATHDLTPC